MKIGIESVAGKMNEEKVLNDHNTINSNIFMNNNYLPHLNLPNNVLPTFSNEIEGFKNKVYEFTDEMQHQEQYLNKIFQRAMKKMTSRTADNSPLKIARLKASVKWRFRIFVIISSILAVTEPILVGFTPVGAAFILQIVVLALSTILFFIGIHLTIVEMPDVIIRYDRSTRRVIQQDHVSVRQHDYIQTTARNTAKQYLPPNHYFSKFIECFDMEVGLEIVCFTFGWSLIFYDSGLAAIRCARVFRFVWYVELYHDQKIYDDPDYNPADHFIDFIRSFEICSQYLEKIYEEIYTAKSKGLFSLYILCYLVTYFH